MLIYQRVFLQTNSSVLKGLPCCGGFPKNQTDCPVSTSADATSLIDPEIFAV